MSNYYLELKNLSFKMNSTKKCTCGFDINHPKIITKTNYSSFGWFLFTILGLSAKPYRIDYYCSECEEKIHSTSEPKILKKNVGR